MSGRGWTQSDLIYLRDNYCKVDVQAIMKYLNRSYSSITFKAWDLGITGRLRCSVNNNFFKVWSDEMAWCLGLLYTDGWLESQTEVVSGEDKFKRVGLEITDIDAITKLSKFMSSTYTISKRSMSTRGKNRKQTYYTRIGSDVLYDDLYELGMKEKKSPDLQFPVGFPIGWMSGFIRGVWDGDGSVLVDKDGYLRCHIGMGSDNFIYGLDEFITRNLGLSEHAAYKYMNSYIIELCGDNARNLCRYIYNDRMGDAYLTRKYDVWLKYKHTRGWND